MINKKKRVILSVICCIVVLTIILCSIWRFYYFHVKNELFRHITSQGHEIVVFEVGHSGPLLDTMHTVLFEVDGTELCLLTIGYLPSERLFPSKSIIVKTDNSEIYHIVFDSDNGNDGEIKFSSDFSRVEFAYAYQLERINSNLQIVQFISQDIL